MITANVPNVQAGPCNQREYAQRPSDCEPSRGEEDADYAIKILNMNKLYGKPIKVNKASAHEKNMDVGANIFVGNLDPEDVSVEVLFEQHDFHSVFKASAAGFIALEGSCRNIRCALIVDCGFSSVTVAPFLDGKANQQGLVRIDVGGKVLTNQLKEWISYRDPNVLEKTYIMNQCKEDACFVSLDFNRDMKIAKYRDARNTIRREYVLPDFCRLSRGYLRDPSQTAKFSQPEDALQFVEETAAYYKKRAAQYLAENGVINYMSYADRMLEEEEQRARKYLNPNPDSVARIVTACRELCSSPCCRIRRSNSWRMPFMIAKNDVEKLRMLYRLIKRTPSGVDVVLKAVDNHIRSEGLDDMKENAMTTTTFTEVGKDPKDIVADHHYKFLDVTAAAANASAEQIADIDVYLYDANPASVGDIHDEFITGASTASAGVTASTYGVGFSVSPVKWILWALILFALVTPLSPQYRDRDYQKKKEQGISPSRRRRRRGWTGRLSYKVNHALSS